MSLPLNATRVGTGTVAVRITGPGRLRPRAQLHAGRQAGDPGAGAPHGARDRQRREPHHLERPPDRPRARLRRGCAVGRAVDRARCRRRCSRRSTAIRSAAPSRSPAGRCRCSTSTSSLPRRISRSMRRSTSASATPSTGCWRARVRTAPSACGRRAATTPGSTPTSPTSSPGRGNAASRFPTSRSGSRSTGCATSSASRPSRNKNGGRDARLCALRAGAQRRRPARRPALPRRHQAQRPRDADRQGADRRGARRRSATARAPNASMRRRSTRSRSSPALEIGREDYGSALRDAAALVTLAAEGGGATPDHPQRGRAGRDGARAHALHLHPGECLARARRPRARQGGRPGLARRRRRGAPGPALSHLPRGPISRARPLKVTNTGDATLQAVVSVTGAPVTPEPAADRGFKIERTYYTLDGEKADVAKVKQNQRFAVVLKITEPNPKFARVIVADYLPAGFEIDNPRLVSSGDTGALVVDRGCGRAGQRRVPRRPFLRRVRSQGRRQGDLHRRLRGARGVARALRGAAGLCGGHVPARPLRPHRHRHPRGRGAK